MSYSTLRHSTLAHSTLPRARRTVRSFGVAFALVLLTGACAPAEAPEPTAEASPTPATTPTVEQAGNASYAGIWEGIDVTLGDGRYENVEERRMAMLVEEVTATGDLDGDGVDDRVVLVVENSGGTGSFLYITALLAADGGSPLPVSFIGDRVQLRGLAVADGRVSLAVVQAGEQDAMCCPGEMASRHWTLRDGVLQEEPMEVTGRWSLEAVAGDWRLVGWDVDDPVEPELSITLTIDGAQVAGHAGCNRYHGDAIEGDAPGDLSFGPIAATKMMCPEPQMRAEQRYLAALGGAMKFGFFNGRLSINTIVDGAVSTLRFERAEE